MDFSKKEYKEIRLVRQWKRDHNICCFCVWAMVQEVVNVGKIRVEDVAKGLSCFFLSDGGCAAASFFLLHFILTFKKSCS